MSGASTAGVVHDAAPQAAPRTRLHWLRRRRPSRGHVLAVIAGLIALVANVAALRAGTPTVTLVVAQHAIEAGERVEPASLIQIQIQAEGDGLSAFLTSPPDVAMVAVVDLPAGIPLRQADLVAAASLESPQLRRMSLPIEPENAAGGRLGVGDRVDVLHVRDGVAAYLVAGIEVLAVAEREDRGFGAIGRYHITVAVDAVQARCLAAALAGGRIEVVQATGSDPVSTVTCRDDAIPGPS